jgi:hypothetical protein
VEPGTRAGVNPGTREPGELARLLGGGLDGGGKRAWVRMHWQKLLEGRVAAVLAEAARGRNGMVST